MNTLETIHARRTIRSYNGQPPTDTQLQQILQAAYAAPVGRAQYDTLCLTVITAPQVLDAWEKAMAELAGNPQLKPFYGAPVVVLVSSVVEPATANLNYSNAAILVENMALAATELGVGACHIWGAIRALPANPQLLAKLDIPQGMSPCCALALGQTDEQYTARELPGDRITTMYIK